MNQHKDERIKVLFVDDEEGNLKAFRTTFRRDMEVLVASSGVEALEILEQEEVHVIVSDQRMPGMTGSEFLAVARERHPRAMRMLLTGYADLEAVVAAVNKGGIYAYATKPWDANDLKLRIEQAFEIHQLRAQKDRLLQQYQQVFDNAADPIVIVDHRGRILDANAACGRLIGMPLEELMRTRFTDHLENASSLVRSLKARRKGREFINVDITVRDRKGDLLDCLMTATYLDKHGQQRDVFQAILKDISDRRQEEKRLLKLNADLDRRVSVRTAQLLEALEDLGSFSYTVAHDLRSPLKNILALSGHLHSHAEDNGDGDVLAFTERISKASQRMIELVDDLLRFSQTNTRDLERRDVELHALVEDLVRQHVPEHRRAEVRIDIAPGTTLLADPPMLLVLLQNLLSNALKFTRTEERPEIVIAHTTQGDRHIIEVRDNGVGFDPKHKDHAFGVFKRLHTADQFEGSGVGLAIVQRIVAKHGGEVSAQSAVGQGTIIRVSLPSSSSAQEAIPFVKVA
ncbi:MAG: response regulator [Flavobacteriales bacterium]|nr:response regulator [Flavobacteriales bacterium]